MNANKLADALESWAKGLFPMPGQLYLKAAAMLRQQQAEIEALKSCELTDEEIEEVIRKHWNREYKNRSMLEFAKAILRKASEK